MLYLLSSLFLTVFSQRRRDDDNNDLCRLPSDRDWRRGGFDEYSECWWWGDPHFTTFDSFYHHFQGKKDSEYYYVKQCLPEGTLDHAGKDLVPFEIIGEHHPCPRRPTAPVACVDKIKIKLPDRTITLDDGFVVKDSTMTNPPPLGCRVYYNVPNEPTEDNLSYYTVTKSTTNGDNFIQVEVYTGKFRFVSDVVVRMNPSSTRGSILINEYYKNLVVGLCGYYDDKNSNDLVYYNPNTGEPEIIETIASDFPTHMRSYDVNAWNLINLFGSKFEVGVKSGEANKPVVPSTCNRVLAETLCKSEYDAQCRCNYDKSSTYPFDFMENCIDESCVMTGPGFTLAQACKVAAEDGCKNRCWKN